MIDFRFSIQNPWHNDKTSPWVDIHQNDKPITKNKTLEYGIDYHTWDWFVLDIDLRWRGEDHAGPKFFIRVFGLGLRIGISDNRHWNSGENRWVNYDNPEEVEKWW
jgi:hypothetical protein